MKTNTSEKNFFSERILVIIFVISCLLGILFRFYNLSWGAPYFFHPDERNIASSISQLSYPDSLNPNFFAYGALPIYSIYFTGVFMNSLQNIVLPLEKAPTSVSFEQAIIIGRGFSFVFSILIIFLIYKIGDSFISKKSGLIAASLASFSMGFIQYAHFATFEMWLSFFTLLLAFFLLKYAKTPTVNYLFLSGLTLGILISIKISSFVFLPLTLIIIFITLINHKVNKQKRIVSFSKALLHVVLFFLTTGLIAVITNPYFLLDQIGSFNSMQYESDVALGRLPVFYTQGFTGSIPLIYQLLKVLPFILNPFVLLAWLFFLPLLIKKLLIQKDPTIFILCAFLLVAFFSQAFLFVKWVRYYIPMLAFLYILLGFLINSFSFEKKPSLSQLVRCGFVVLLVISFIYSFSYFKTVLASPDTRLEASRWAEKNIPHNALILSETYDLGVIPFNPLFFNIMLFNFYELEENPSKKYELQQLVDYSEYIILPSQRVLETRINNKMLFPEGYKFYNDLLMEKGNYKLVYQTPCDIFCKILYLGNPALSFEQTANVFDRPQVFIFQNDKKNISEIEK